MIFSKERAAKPDTGSGRWSKTVSDAEKLLRRQRIAGNRVVHAYTLIEESQIEEMTRTQKLFRPDTAGLLGKAIHLYADQRKAEETNGKILEKYKSPVLVQVIAAVGKECFVDPNQTNAVGELNFSTLNSKGFDSAHYVRNSKKQANVKRHVWGVYNYDQIMWARCLTDAGHPFYHHVLVNRLNILSPKLVVDTDGATKLQFAPDENGVAQVLSAVESYMDRNAGPASP